METLLEFAVSIARLLGRRGERRWIHMTNDLATDHEQYVVEVDGAAKAEYRIFVKALRAGLQLKQELPDSCIKLRDADQQPAH